MNIEKFKPRVLDILRSSDLETITSKSVRKLLQQGTSEPLDPYKKELNALIMQCLDLVNEPSSSSPPPPPPPLSKPAAATTAAAPSMTQSTVKMESSPLKVEAASSKGIHHASPPSNKMERSKKTKKRTAATIDSDDEDDGSKSNKKKRKTPKKRNVDTATLQKNPFTKSWLLSNTLSDVTGEKALSRPGVVKALWKYIKENELQDTSNKTFIVCDDKLRQVFEGQDRIHCFTMNKFIGKHLSDLPADYVLEDGSK